MICTKTITLYTIAKQTTTSPLSVLFVICVFFNLLYHKPMLKEDISTHQKVIFLDLFTSVNLKCPQDFIKTFLFERFQLHRQSYILGNMIPLFANHYFLVFRMNALNIKCIRLHNMSQGSNNLIFFIRIKHVKTYLLIMLWHL